MASQRMVTWLCVSVISLISLSRQHQGDWRLEVEPRFIHVTPGSPVTLTCTLSDGAGGRVPLAGCGFREYFSGTTWDIGTGSATINNTIEGEETSALITSNTEDAGRCRLQFEGLPVGYTFLLGCRVRPVTGAWRYAAMMVVVSGRSPQQYRLQPPGVLVSQPGSDVILTGLAEHEVERCLFSLPPDNTGIYLYSATSKNTTEYRAWREGRRCGVTLLSVKPEQSGFVRSWVWSFSTYTSSADFVELLVARAPESPPWLTLNSEPFHTGDILSATCIVTNSTPVSNITWLLGGEVIREDRVNEGPAETAWRWSYEPQTILQRLSHRLRNIDDGKVLKCQAGHLALPGGFKNSNSFTIRFKASQASRRFPPPPGEAALQASRPAQPPPGEAATQASRRDPSPPDACSPSPCGPYSQCRAHGSFATCSCQPPYIGQPPSCHPECSFSSNCPLDKACVNQTCQDPCPGTGCGQDAVCDVVSHVPTCRCPVNFRGDPKTLCEPTNPCTPNPCGPNSVCHDTGKYIRCSCLPRHTGSTPHCRPECVGNADCPEGKACVESVCEDVCPGDCGINALCRVISHASLCECPEGFSGDPHTRCEEEHPCTPNPCGPNSVCHVTGKYIRCSCLPRHTGSDPHCRPECVGNADCPEGKACVESVCEDVCPGDCGINALCRVISHASLCECPEGFSGDPHTRCEEEPCGMQYSYPVLISGGHQALKGEFPWHAAIFKVLSNGDYSALCGGTLIKPDIVVTAGHCFYDDRNHKLTPSSSVKVAMGKLHLGWDVDLNDTEVQRFDVANVFAPGDFRGINNDVRHDIAVVKLATKATMTSEVNVACIDWGLRHNPFNRDQLKTGDIGKVAGWGITHKSTERSPVLQWIDLPWVNKDTCRLATHLGSRRFLTRDKFCAGYVNQSRSVCPGDSGGGLVFFNATKQRYYLKGVVSTSLALNVQTRVCYADHYTAFTSVGEYINWIIEQF